MGSRTIQVTDFQRSAVRWRIDTTKKPVVTVSRPLPMTLNNVRAVIEARAVITEPGGGRAHDYVLTASCKTEQVWVQRDVWHEPNADMCMVASAGEFMVVKRWEKVDRGVLRHPPALGPQPERQVDRADDCFDRFSVDRSVCPGQVLTDTAAIVAALAGTAPVVAQTEYETAGYHVKLEYPVKVVNFSEREGYYQVDTGPVLLPLFEGDGRNLLECCQLAYVAHNSPGWAEFIVCVPTPVAEGVRVHHYSRRVRLEPVCNRMIAVLPA